MEDNIEYDREQDAKAEEESWLDTVDQVIR